MDKVLAPAATLQCSRCEEIKPLDCFERDRRAEHGVCTVCKECTNRRRRENYRDNVAYREKVKDRARRYAEVNKDSEAFKRRRREFSKKYTATPKAKKSHRDRERRYRGNPKYRFRQSFSSAVSACLRKKSNNWAGKRLEKVIGYPMAELFLHLEKQFVEGMCWDNYGNGYGKWSLDHIIAQIHWDFSSHEDTGFKLCWSLDNLQPLWSLENSSKGSR